ncbi:hypothetical protein CGLO_13885 [Colletotrichum gloeosporioides Cg-14]|uniref:Uncharacterized protein n=1 Tax=Colletotrichum gloeosporioides (strain Cg-14) TaxID=1237896 RepID=T0L635_COLGC|nr:hypothetical protein CGLO_13885 [Colletotrichum gloeosporioides Cg-14]
MRYTFEKVKKVAVAYPVR